MPSATSTANTGCRYVQYRLDNAPGGCPSVKDLLRTRYFGRLIRSIVSNMNNYCPRHTSAFGFYLIDRCCQLPAIGFWNGVEITASNGGNPEQFEQDSWFAD